MRVITPGEVGTLCYYENCCHPSCWENIRRYQDGGFTCVPDTSDHNSHALQTRIQSTPVNFQKQPVRSMQLALPYEKRDRSIWNVLDTFAGHNEGGRLPEVSPIRCGQESPALGDCYVSSPLNRSHEALTLLSSVPSVQISCKKKRRESSLGVWENDLKAVIWEPAYKWVSKNESNLKRNWPKPQRRASPLFGLGRIPSVCCSGSGRGLSENVGDEILKTKPISRSSTKIVVKSPTEEGELTNVQNGALNGKSKLFCTHLSERAMRGRLLPLGNARVRRTIRSTELCIMPFKPELLDNKQEDISELSLLKPDVVFSSEQDLLEESVEKTPARHSSPLRKVRELSLPSQVSLGVASAEEPDGMASERVRSELPAYLKALARRKDQTQPTEALYPERDSKAKEIHATDVIPKLHLQPPRNVEIDEAQDWRYHAYLFESTLSPKMPHSSRSRMLVDESDPNRCRHLSGGSNRSYADLPSPLKHQHSYPEEQNEHSFIMTGRTWASSTPKQSANDADQTISSVSWQRLPLRTTSRPRHWYRPADTQCENRRSKSMGDSEASCWSASRYHQLNTEDTWPEYSTEGRLTEGLEKYPSFRADFGTDFTLTSTNRQTLTLKDWQKLDFSTEHRIWRRSRTEGTEDQTPRMITAVLQGSAVIGSSRPSKSERREHHTLAGHKVIISPRPPPPSPVRMTQFPDIPTDQLEKISPSK
ncbi:unnamed protein product [Calicophoron daubneyi]|uniref:Uncharacterized protein n=1 Tax=Calicophoron daubneyi TaxID=300641 RepID=A0AAV2T3V4_CALDB